MITDCLYIIGLEPKTSEISKMNLNKRIISLYFPVLQGFWGRRVRTRLHPPPDSKRSIDLRHSGKPAGLIRNPFIKTGICEILDNRCAFSGTTLCVDLGRRRRPAGLKREMQSRFESIPRNNGAKKTKHFEASGLDSGFRRNDRFVAGLFYVWRRERLEKNPCFDTHKKATSNEMALY